MGTKYTTIASSGYNQSPPPDDGSTVSTNLEKWSDVKTKIGDPVKTLADAINTSLVAFTDFSGRVSSANETTLAADHMKTIECTTTQTETLLDATTAGAGYIVGFKNTGSGVVTIALQTAGNTLDGTANGTCTIPANSTARFKVNGAANGYYSLTKTIIAGANVTITEGVGGRTISSSSLPAATTADMKAATSNVVAVTPLKVQNHPGVAKAWVDFSAAGGIITVNASYNIASVVRNSTGNYTITFTTSFLSANYAVLPGTCTGYTGSSLTLHVYSLIQYGAPYNKTASVCQISCEDYATTPHDSGGFYVAFFGDQ